jgi:putative sterol carrier protein
MQSSTVPAPERPKLPQRTIAGPDRTGAQARQQEEEKMPQFPSDEWIKALMQTVNESESYRESAKEWEGDFYFVVNEGSDVPQDVYLYMDLWHGECREAYEATDPDAKTPEFVIRASVFAWRKVIEKKIDPIRALMTRQLKLTGTMTKIMKQPKTAIELVNCCTLVETTWPE